MARFWRAEVSARFLANLIEHLPPDSALHRARQDGQVWTWNEALLWRLLHMLERNEQWWKWAKGKRPKWPKFKAHPWERSMVQMGDRGDASSQQVIDYLKSIAPPKRK